MDKPYSVHGGDRAGPVDHSQHATFDEALKALVAARRPGLVLTISNDDRADYCSELGYDDGLTEEERELLEGA